MKIRIYNQQNSKPSPFFNLNLSTTINLPFTIIKKQKSMSFLNFYVKYEFYLLPNLISFNAINSYFTNITMIKAENLQIHVWISYKHLFPNSKTLNILCLTYYL